MGISVFPILEDRESYEDIPKEFWFVEWKWLRDSVDATDHISDDLGLTPLNDFISYCSYCRIDAIRELSAGEVEDIEAEAVLKDGCFVAADGCALWTPERQWFDAANGLKTARGLMTHLQEHPDSVDAEEYDEDDIESFVDVLQEFEKFLIEAQQNGKRFYLAIG